MLLWRNSPNANLHLLGPSGECKPPKLLSSMVGFEFSLCVLSGSDTLNKSTRSKLHTTAIIGVLSQNVPFWAGFVI